MYTSGGCCTELGKTLAIWKTTCGAIASTAGVDLSIPPVAPADVPAISAQELGHLPAVLTSTCGALDVYLRWYRLHSARVNLSIPPVAPADVPAMYRPLIGTSTCGAKIYHIEPDTARSPIVSARRKGAKVTPRPQRNAEQMETDRRARCGGTIEVGAMYGDSKGIL